MTSTALLDDFNRADENPLSDGGAWTGFATAKLKVVSNQCGSAGTATAIATAAWMRDVFGPDCEVYVTVPVLPASADFIRLYLRLNNEGLSNETSFMMQWSNDANGCRIFNQTATGAFTQKAQAAAATYAAGDVISFTAVGSTLSAYKNGALILTATDTGHSAAGHLQIGIKNTAGRFDDFGGGTLSTTPGHFDARWVG